MGTQGKRAGLRMGLEIQVRHGICVGFGRNLQSGDCSKVAWREQNAFQMGVVCVEWGIAEDV